VLTSDYNAVVDRFSTNGGTSVTSTLAQWQVFGYDTQSFVSTASALFVDAAAKDTGWRSTESLVSPADRRGAAP
jgi:hypothetical protein